MGSVWVILPFSRSARSIAIDRSPGLVVLACDEMADYDHIHLVYIPTYDVTDRHVIVHEFSQAYTPYAARAYFFLIG